MCQNLCLAPALRALLGPQAIEDDKLPDGVQTQFARNLALAWYRVAIARVQESRLAEQWEQPPQSTPFCEAV